MQSARRLVVLHSTLIGVCLFAAGVPRADSTCPDIQKVTLPPGGGPAGGDSWSPRLSNDGRYLAFISSAWDLVPGPAASRDVLFFDRDTSSLVRATKSADGLSAADLLDWESLRGLSLSGDGRHVAFMSDATNMVEGDAADSYEDIYVWDRDTDSIEKVTRSHEGGSANAGSQWPSISGDGRYVVFESQSTELVAGDAIDTTSDIFRWDRDSGSIEKVSQTPAGETGNSDSRAPMISADGRHVAFVTDAPNLLGGSYPAYFSFAVWDATTREHRRVAGGADPWSGAPLLAISADGGAMALLTAEPLNAEDERASGFMLYRWDRATDAYTLITRALEPWEQPSSQSLNFALPHTLEFFEPNVTLASVVIWTDIYYTTAYVEGQDYELVTDGDGYTTVVRIEGGAIPPSGTAQAQLSYTRTSANGRTGPPSISPDGRFVGFESTSTNLVPGGSTYPGPEQAFVWDAETQTIERISTSLGGGDGNGDSHEVMVSTGAGSATFASNSWDLVSGDTDDDVSDIFVASPCMAVPEPSGALLQLFACLALAGLRRTWSLRRRRTGVAVATGLLLLAAVPPAEAQGVEADAAVALTVWVYANFSASPTLDPGHDDITDGTNNDLVLTDWLEQGSASESFHEIYEGTGESGLSRFETEYDGSASLSTGTVGSEVLAVDLNNASAAYWTTYAVAEYYEWLQLSGPTDSNGNYVVGFTIDLGPFDGQNMQPPGFTYHWSAKASTQVIAEPLDTSFPAMTRSAFANLEQACPNLGLPPCFGQSRLLTNTGEVTVPGATPVLRVSHSSLVSARSATSNAPSSHLQMQLPAGVVATPYQPVPEPDATWLQAGAIATLLALRRARRSKARKELTRIEVP